MLVVLCNDACCSVVLCLAGVDIPIRKSQVGGERALWVRRRNSHCARTSSSRALAPKKVSKISYYGASNASDQFLSFFEFNIYIILYKNKIHIKHICSSDRNTN